MNKKQILRRLTSYKDDLTDDSSDIHDINRKIEDLAEEFEAAIKSDNAGSTASKIINLREASQCSDSDISKAASNLQDEIYVVQREITIEEAEEAAAKKIAEEVSRIASKAKVNNG